LNKIANANKFKYKHKSAFVYKEIFMAGQLLIGKAIIPAAGAGSRMGYLSNILPKCMYPVADKPIIHRVVDNARMMGVEEFIVITHFKEKIIHDYFEKVLAPDYKIKVTFIHQDKLSGLADAIALGEKMIDEPFAVILGDDFTMAADFNGLLRSFAAHENAVVVEGIVHETHRRSLMETCCVERSAEGCILRIEEKPAEPFAQCRGTGFYLFRPEVFARIHATPVTSTRHEREITETIKLLAREGRAYAEFIRGINLNINSFDDLLQAWNTFAHLQSFLAAAKACKD